MSSLPIIQLQLVVIGFQILMLSRQLRAVMLILKPPTPKPIQAVATQAASRSVGEKAGEVAISRPEGNSRA